MSSYWKEVGLFLPVFSVKEHNEKMILWGSIEDTIDRSDKEGWLTLSLEKSWLFLLIFFICLYILTYISLQQDSPCLLQIDSWDNNTER